MADVAIIHAADKGAAATRLAEAVAAAGFGVDSVEIEDPAGLADAVEASAADARILIWSRPFVSHALHSGDLPRIRQIRGLIEVSADGITPPSRGDETRVVSISGWRGQPFHPGWQRIHLELKRLCGSRKATAEPAPRPAVAKNPNPNPERAGPADPAGGARPRASRLMLGGGAAVLLVAAAVGAANWVGRGTTEPPPSKEVRQAGPPAAVAEAPPPGPATELQAPYASAAPTPAGTPPPAPSAGRPAAANAEPEAFRAAPAVRPAPSGSVARPKRRPSPPAAPVKKYSRKNSKVMRQFCERSGRSTPQCRTFLRSVAAD